MVKEDVKGRLKIPSWNVIGDSGCAGIPRLYATRLWGDFSCAEIPRFYKFGYKLLTGFLRREYKHRGSWV